VRYDKAQGDVLSDISLELPAGSRVALIGHNGAGKSTLLKTLVGLQAYQQGDVRIYGRPVRACHHRVAYLPQRGEIDWQFPIALREFIMTGRYVHMGWLRRASATDVAMVARTMAQLQLDHVADRLISDLSGGQQQRALLARAIVQEAQLLLLDEPYNNIDPETRLLIGTMVKTLQHEGRTTIIATHDVSRLQEEYEYVVSLKHGHVEYCVPVAHVHLRKEEGADGTTLAMVD
jgi:manganese/zinc/iron transport system ATP- binding protein